MFGGYDYGVSLHVDYSVRYFVLFFYAITAVILWTYEYYDPIYKGVKYSLHITSNIIIFFFNLCHRHTPPSFGLEHSRFDKITIVFIAWQYSLMDTLKARWGHRTSSFQFSHTVSFANFYACTFLCPPSLLRPNGVSRKNLHGYS